MSTSRQAKKTRNGERRGAAHEGRAARGHAAEEATLPALVGEIEALERDRAELCSVLSHDLRNPLTVVLWSAQSLARTLPPDHPGRRQLDAIRRASDELSLMLDDLSDAARVRDGRIKLSLAPHEPASLVADAALATQSLRASKEISLDLQVAEGLRPVRCDRERVTRVLGHLLAGAARVTPKKQAIVVRAAPLSGDEGEGVRLSVEDAGSGIPEDERASLFDLPSAPPLGTPRRPRATAPGLALFVARGIVEAHGGRIQVEGEPGRGTRFVITLPVNPEGEPPGGP